MHSHRVRAIHFTKACSSLPHPPLPLLRQCTKSKDIRGGYSRRSVGTCTSTMSCIVSLNIPLPRLEMRQSNVEVPEITPVRLLCLNSAPRRTILCALRSPLLHVSRPGTRSYTAHRARVTWAKARYHNFLRSGTLLRRNYLYPLLWRPRMGKLWYHGAMSEAERLIQCIGDSHPTCAKSLANRGLVGMRLLHCPGISGLTSSRLNCI